MSKESSPQPCFTPTEHEKLYDHISHNRFLALVMQPDVDIHEINVSTNSFGEYLFVTLSCRAEQPKRPLTFWGLGYHEHRERWIVETWQGYELLADLTDEDGAVTELEDLGSSGLLSCLLDDNDVD